MDPHLLLNTSVLLTPRRAGLHTGRDHALDVLVRIQAPDAPEGHAARRPPQALALVIDRSGSMQGRPLAEARRCAEHVVGMLRPTDWVSLVQFDDVVRRLWPAVPIGDGIGLRAAIAGIEPGGRTDLHGGWLEGVRTLDDVPGDGLKRVILLSDGQANAGQTDLATISAHGTEAVHHGITTSTYGLGDNFNENLMVAMARAGGGNHYYGATADDLMDPFQQELELLNHLCLRELRLSATVPEGVQVQMLNDLPAVGGGWCLRDLAWCAEAWAVLRLTVPAGLLPAVGQWLPVLQVSVLGLSLDGDPVILERTSLALQVLSAADFAALADDDGVARRSVELAAADALARVREAARQRHWSEVDRLLDAAMRQFAGNDWVAAVLAAMRQLAEGRSQERMMKEALYTAAHLQTRLSARDEGILSWADAESGERPAFLRRKRSQGTGEV